jgi:hypothetical protein
MKVATRTILTIFLQLCTVAAAPAANYTINNPADKIFNPADRMYNPSTEIKNPATTITNPAEQISTDPSPAAPGAQPAAKLTEQVQPAADKKAGPVVEKKYYTFKKVRDYINAAKKAFVKDDILEFVALIEDAQRRIASGSLKASAKTVKKLAKYRAFGYALLEPDKD